MTLVASLALAASQYFYAKFRTDVYTSDIRDDTDSEWIFVLTKNQGKLGDITGLKSLAIHDVDVQPYVPDEDLSPDTEDAIARGHLAGQSEPTNDWMMDSDPPSDSQPDRIY